MVRIDRVVTRGGDEGETSLGDGARVRKDAVRVEAIGALDEANTAVGLLRLHTSGRPEDAMLARIQNDLFDAGADVCVPGEAGERLRLNDAPNERMEAEIAQMNAALPKLSSFVLPGGTPAAAYAHLARAAVRRAERCLVALHAEAPVNGALLRFLNRLSDHLFVLSRVLNQGKDVLWVPGANR